MKPMRALGALTCTALLGLASAPGNALAGATYDGLASLTLTLTNVNGGSSIPAGLTVGYQTLVHDSSTSAEGTATAEAVETRVPADTLSPVKIGDPLIQISHSYGAASAPGGYAASLMQTDGIISIDNQSGAAVTVRLTYVFSAEVAALMDLTGLGAAANAGWSLGDDLGQVYIDDGIFADAIVGPTGNSLTLSDYLELTLASAETRILLSTVDSDGVAEAPAPPVWTLLGAGLALGGLIRRRAPDARVPSAERSSPAR